MRLGIIIPYRKRDEHLQQIAPVLKRRGRVFVVEQKDDKPFNRGKLINIGYKEFNDQFDYFAAHDVDMIPTSANYSYSENPCHLATEASQFEYKMPYENYFGGVTLFPNDKFEKVNGFSNEFWGYGGEDDFIRRRFIDAGVDLQSRQCRFECLPHLRIIDNDLRRKNALKLREQDRWGDGLTSCQYEVVNCIDKENYTLLQVKL